MASKYSAVTGDATLAPLDWTNVLTGILTGPIKVITNCTKAEADREILTHSETIGTVAGCAVGGLWLGSRWARRNVRAGKAPFLGFMG